MSAPENLKFSKSHEWAKQEADGTVTVGITHHAQDLLGDMVFVENPAIGRKVKAGEECAVVESVKAASDVYAPISGEIVATNSEVESAPEKINQDAFSAWMFKIKPDNAAEINNLLSSGDYQTLIENEAH